jgi:hypothetical protein
MPAARILIVASNGKPPHKAQGKDIALNSLNHALEKYQIIIDPNLVRRVFAEAFPSFATASARRLRDKIMHLFHSAAIDQIRARGNQLFADMDSVIQGLGEKAETHEGF